MVTVQRNVAGHFRKFSWIYLLLMQHYIKLLSPALSSRIDETIIGIYHKETYIRRTNRNILSVMSLNLLKGIKVIAIMAYCCKGFLTPKADA